MLCKGEEGGGVEWSRVDEIGFVNDSQYHGVQSHDDLHILGLSRFSTDPDGAWEVSGTHVEMKPRGRIQAPIDWGSMSPSDLHCGSIHVVALGSLCMRGVISDLAV